MDLGPVMSRLAVALTLALTLAAGALSGCAGGGPAMMSATAEFADVGSLAHHAAVELAGVNIGYVSHIQVDGPRARLTLRFPVSAALPINAQAQVRRAAVLGPQVIELVVPPNSQSQPRLADGARIATTDVRPDLEDLIKSGTDLLGALSTTDLARLLQENAQGFGGRGAELHQVLDDLNTVLSGYATRTSEISRLVTDIDTFTASVGPQAEANAQALTNLAQATAVLDRQRQRLTDLLASLDRVSTQGVAFLSTELPQLTDQLIGVRQITQALANQQAALAKLLVYLQGHNLALSSATVNSFVQVLNDFVICGLPAGPNGTSAGGEDPKSPLNACANVPQKAAP